MTTDYQELIFRMKYSRGGLETWHQTINRLVDYLETQDLTVGAYHYLNAHVAPLLLRKQVMPSMRLLATAGPAVQAENLMAFNCMFMGIQSWSDFGRLMYALMCGTGVGFSVEQNYISCLGYIPRVAPVETVVIPDTRQGWADSYNQLILQWLNGYDPVVDYSLIRPQGSILKTTGGYASGPEPLRELIAGTKHWFRLFRERSWRPIEIYDVCCKIADVVVQGGVRRSATICLFDHTDQEMLGAKDPSECQLKPWRYNSNNSMVVPDEDTARQMLPLILEKAQSSGEPGLIIKSTLIERGNALGRQLSQLTTGVNPCGEIILQSGQVCNLTEVVLRPTDSLEDHMEAVEAAVFLGLLQSRLLDYSDLMWLTARLGLIEPLLGVSLTGLMDTPELLLPSGDGEGLRWLREYAHECATKWAAELKMPKVPVAITTVKPSGTVSKLVDSSPGAHPRFSRYYLSNIGVSSGSPLEVFLREQGVPVRHSDGNTTVFSFPQKAPEGAIVSDQLTALQQLELAQRIQESWCDHNVSCTIYVARDEWADVLQWCLGNTSSIAGITFLPKFEALDVPYMPLERLTADEYNRLSADLPKVDWSLFKGDARLVPTREFTCIGGSCS